MGISGRRISSVFGWLALSPMPLLHQSISFCVVRRVLFFWDMIARSSAYASKTILGIFCVTFLINGSMASTNRMHESGPPCGTPFSILMYEPELSTYDLDVFRIVFTR